MKRIIIDVEIYNIIYQMCDLALKRNGMENKEAVDLVLNYFEPEPPKKEDEKK